MTLSEGLCQVSQHDAFKCQVVLCGQGTVQSLVAACQPSETGSPSKAALHDSAAWWFMDVASGFQLEQPQMIVRWGVSEQQLKRSFSGSDFYRVTDGYFVSRRTSLCGLTLKVGFHFAPRLDGSLVEFELFENGYAYPDASYQEFQRLLEMTFGAPTLTSPGTEGFPSHIWRINDFQIIHEVREHSGPAEYVRITRINPAY